MKREKIIDLRELIRAFWKPSQEEIAYEDGGTVDVDLTGIDTKVWDEAFKNIKGDETEFIKSENAMEKENKRNSKNHVDRKNVQIRELENKDTHSKTQEREIGE